VFGQERVGGGHAGPAGLGVGSRGQPAGQVAGDPDGGIGVRAGDGTLEQSSTDGRQVTGVEVQSVGGGYVERGLSGGEAQRLDQERTRALPQGGHTVGAVGRAAVR